MTEKDFEAWLAGNAMKLPAIPWGPSHTKVALAFAKHVCGEADRDGERYRYLRRLMYVSGKGWLLGKAIPCIGEYDYNLAGAKMHAAFDMAVDVQLPERATSKREGSPDV